MDQYDHLLLNAARIGNGKSIQTYLSSISDPNIYLNRIYNESNDQKCTLLTIACLNGHTDVMHMLLDCFKPDLEILNTIRLDEPDGQAETYRDVTVLWAAAAINQFTIVKRLIEQGANINHRTSTNSTPVRCACYSGNLEMARYLIEHGADINAVNYHKGTNLAVSVYRKHLKVTEYLVDELGCDINQCDNDGRTPLYYAVKCESLELVQALLSRGAHNFPDTHYRISPLMLAAEKRRTDLLDAISIRCSILEQIEAKELLGSAFSSAEHGPCDLQQSYEYYRQALELRSIHQLSKPLRETTNTVFNHRQESQTIDELKKIQFNSENMFIEGLLIRERLLGPTSEIYRYSLTYRGADLADHAQFHQATALWLYELRLRQQYFITIDHKRLRLFGSILSEMVHASLLISIKAIVTVMTILVEEIKQNRVKIDYNLYTFLFMTTIISQVKSSLTTHPNDNEHFPIDDWRVIYRSIHDINDESIVCIYKSSLLHLCVNGHSSSSDAFIDRICKYPCLNTVRILLQCGADVNTRDSVGNTPLHILVANSNACDENILELLCDAGAHLDYANDRGETPVDIATHPYTKQLLQRKMQMKLKCLCAQLIRKINISYHEHITTSLIKFVERH